MRFSQYRAIAMLPLVFLALISCIISSVPAATAQVASSPVTQSSVICGQVKFATVGSVLDPVLLPFDNSGVALWRPQSFAHPDAYYRILDPQIAALNPPLQSQEYGAIQREITSWSSYVQISGANDCAPTPPPPTPTPNVSIAPTSGPAGTTVTATGTKWASGGQVIDILWDGNFLTETNADDAGNFTYSFAISQDAAAGDHQLTIRDGNTGFEGTARFTVTAAPPPPPTVAPPTPEAPSPPPIEVTPLPGQQTLSSISGRVIDANGTGIPDVKITVTDGAGTKIKSVHTLPNGEYKISDLPPGVYIVTPSLDGFTFAPPSADPATVPPKVEQQKFRGTSLLAQTPIPSIIPTVVPTIIPTLPPTIRAVIQPTVPPTTAPTFTPRPTRTATPRAKLTWTPTWTPQPATAEPTAISMTAVAILPPKDTITGTNTLSSTTALTSTDAHTSTNTLTSIVPLIVSVGYNAPKQSIKEEDVAGIDTRSIAAVPREIMPKNQYLFAQLENKSVDEVIKQLKQASIFYYVGHGNSWTGKNGRIIRTAIAVWDGVKYGYLEGGSGIDREADGTRRYLGNISKGDLKQLKLVVINGCVTGEGADEVGNLLKSFQDRGVNMVIGFTTTIVLDSAESWGKKFWENLANGKGARDAAEDAANHEEQRQHWLRNSAAWIHHGNIISIKNLKIIQSGSDVVVVPAPPR